MKLRRSDTSASRLSQRIARVIAILALLTIPAVLFASMRPAGAAVLGMRYIQLSDNQANATNAMYKVGFNVMTAGTLGSVFIQMCNEYQYVRTDPCTPPNGLNMSGASLFSQLGINDVSITSSTVNTLTLSRVPGAVTPQPVVYEIQGINNPSTPAPYYVRISTYASNNATGPETDFGSLAIVINNALQIAAEVPPYLEFCTGITIPALDCSTASGASIDFGELSTASTRTATSQFMTGTNASNGYAVTLSGLTMTAGTRVIPAMLGAGSQAGVSQFGINLRQNTAPAIGSDPAGSGSASPSAAYGTPNSFRFVSGDILASDAGRDDYRRMTVSYIANISTAQEPGHYVSTVTYIALANF